MVEITILLEDGFMEDEVAIAADGKEIFREHQLSTRYQISLAKAIKLKLEESTEILSVLVPSRDLAKDFPLDLSKTVLIRISIAPDGDLVCHMMSEEFGYM